MRLAQDRITKWVNKTTTRHHILSWKHQIDLALQHYEDTVYKWSEYQQELLKNLDDWQISPFNTHCYLAFGQREAELNLRFLATRHLNTFKFEHKLLETDFLSKFLFNECLSTLDLPETLELITPYLAKLDVDGLSKIVDERKLVVKPMKDLIIKTDSDIEQYVIKKVKLDIRVIE